MKPKESFDHSPTGRLKHCWRSDVLRHRAADRHKGTGAGRRMIYRMLKDIIVLSAPAGPLQVIPGPFRQSHSPDRRYPQQYAFAVSVRRTRDLPPPSFRFRVTTDTFGLGYTLPTTGRVRDLHPLDCAHAGRIHQIGQHRDSNNAVLSFL